MLRKILLGLLTLLGLAALGVAVGLAMAHAAVRRERAPLPSREEVVASAGTADQPVRLTIANTASQPMPRSLVLDAKHDLKPDEPYVMSHPSFILEWADGRTLLVDVGMDREGAVNFGAPMGSVGAEPIEPHGSVAAQLGSEASRVEGVVFTHLHTDHVDGITELCRGRTRPLQVFMTEAQNERPNYTERGGRELLATVKRGAQGEGDAPCVEIVPLGDGALKAVPGFPGAFVIAAGGHTPGSQIVTANVNTGGSPVTYAFTGDIVNHIDGVGSDIAKPQLYRMVVVPEADDRQTELRHFLRSLRDEGGVRLLVSHDELQLGASGVPAYR